MGCGNGKQSKVQKQSKPSSLSVIGQQLEASTLTYFVQTEPIEADYIFHALDPLATQRSYIKKGVSKTNSSIRIIKIYNCYGLSTSNKSVLDKALNSLLQLKHLNVSNTTSYYYYDHKLYLVGEYYDGGNLLTQLDKFSQLSQTTMLNVFCQIIAGLQYLHEFGVVHGDVRLEHILFANKSMEKIKLIDFCIPSEIKATCNEWKPKNTVSEISFLSPEALKGQTTMKSDIWSCGCLLYFFLTSHMPFFGKNIQSIKNSILRGVVNFDGQEWVNINPDMKKLVSLMLSSNPKSRPSAKFILNHPALSNKQIINKPNKQLQKHMKEFKLYSQVQTAMLIYIAENLMSEQDKNKLMDEFVKFDLNNDGFLTKEELLKVYSQTLPEDRAIKEVNNIFKKIDSNKSGKIDYQGMMLQQGIEFIIATIDQKKYFNREKLLQLFQQLDRDHSGQLSKQEVKKMLRDMQIPNNKYDQLSKQLDQNGDGEITQDEFLSMMLTI